MEDLFWFIFQGFSHVDWTHCFQTVVKENNTEGNTWFSETVHLRKAWMLTSGKFGGSHQNGLQAHLNLEVHLRKAWRLTSERPGGTG